MKKLIKTIWKAYKRGAASSGNALANKSVVQMSAVLGCGFELVKGPPYSPDLAAIAAATDLCMGAFS